MAKDDKKKKKDRKPSAITGAGIKAVKELAKQAAKAGKRTKYKGKLTQTGKENLVIKTLTDPADKEAIAAAKSIKNRNEIAKKAESKELKRGIKGSRKDAGKAKAEIREKNKVIDKKNTERRSSMERQAKQSKLKEALKGKQATRESQREYNRKAMEAQKNERRLPDVPEAAKSVRSPLKPVTKKNAAKGVTPKPVSGKPPVIKSKSKVKPKSSKATKAVVGTAGAIVGAAALKNASKSKKETKADSKSIDKSSKNVSSKKIESKAKAAKPQGKSAAVKAPAKEAKPVGTTSQALDKAVSSPAVKKKFGDKVPPKLKSQALAEARKEIAKQRKSNVPWEKILESITMLMSSYILRGGISKRYK